MIRYSIALLAFISITSPITALADRIWDKDLKRYLTEQEMTMAEVFLTE